MPNWCSNHAVIRHTDPQQLKDLAEAINREEFCSHVAPVPEALKIDSCPGTGDAELQKIYEQNRSLYGAATWYDWCVSHWGTKWDVVAYDTVAVKKGAIEFAFDSAWAPPLGIYALLEQQGFQVEATYCEPGMAFVGRWILGEDDYWDYSGLTPDEVRAEIPQDLDEDYGISSMLEEWLAEAEEE